MVVVFSFFQDRKKWIYPKARFARLGGLPSVGRLWCIKVLWYYRSMAYIRKFKTGSGKTGVQVCYKEQGRVVKTVHVGSAESEKGIMKLLKKAQGIIDSEKRSLFDLNDFNI